MSSPKKWSALVVSLVVCLGTGAVGAAWTNTSLSTWYGTLEKPPWNPPDWVFGPVWTGLYIGMAVAAWLVWLKKDLSSSRAPLRLFSVQLILNGAWSFLFFGLRSPALALADIVLLWCAILATISSFRRVSNWAAALLAPYFAWVSFAAVLNWTLWRLNGA
jgi:tryptophan-rich sensory protein